MEIAFSSHKLRELFNSDKLLQKKYGAAMAKKIRQRLDMLQQAKSLETIRPLAGRCHELKGGRAGQLALDLVHPYRLIFEPDHDPVPAKEDGGLDWSKVTSVRIVEVVDYHE